MAFQMTVEDYAGYLKLVYKKIHSERDYITDLDAATGDGDHWVNINMGFEKLAESAEELSVLDFGSAFKKIGMIMMSVIGGSGGVLYGSAYMEAAKVVGEKTVIGSTELCDILEAMMNGIMKRGKAGPGMKTMLDALYPAVCCYKSNIADGTAEDETLKRVRAAASFGAESTRHMEAVRGRACYQTGKGAGHLDPGAVTMAYQVETLIDYILDSGRISQKN